MSSNSEGENNVSSANDNTSNNTSKNTSKNTNVNKKKFKVSKRRQARIVAMQALYQWQCNPGGVSELLSQFLIEHAGRADKVYCEKLITGAIGDLDKIDEIMKPALDRPIAKVSPIELSILRVAVFELNELHEVPYKVVINEAIELAKEYGAEGSQAFINAVLDKIAPDLRPLELNKN